MIYRALKLFYTILQWLIHVIIHSLKFIESIAPRVNPIVNYELLVITTCQHSFIDCSKCITLVRDFDGRGGCSCVGWVIWKLSILFTQFWICLCICVCVCVYFLVKHFIWWLLNKFRCSLPYSIKAAVEWIFKKIVAMPISVLTFKMQC